MSRDLPEFPNLDHLKKQAKVLLRKLQQPNPGAKLAEAQHAIAREYGFASWAKLKARVESLPHPADAAPAPGAAGSSSGGGRGGGTTAGTTDPPPPDDSGAGRGSIFGRYTERARRVMFFARYEAGQLGRVTIESEHMLLGLLREEPQLILGCLQTGDSLAAIRNDVEEQTNRNDKTSTSVDLPLTAECKRILKHAAEESEESDHIRPQHLLLGLLREEECLASSILRTHGLDATLVRDKAKTLEAWSTRIGYVPDIETATRVAEAVWLPVFGAETVESQKPFRAELLQDKWLVRGAVGTGSGETLFVRIAKADCRILEMPRQSVESGDRGVSP